MQITLYDGTTQDLREVDRQDLSQLHWEQEREFARQIREAPKGSAARSAAFGAGYDAITKLIAFREGATESGVVMGLNPRYVRLVLRLLAKQRPLERGWRAPPRLFEIGYGSGAMLAAVAEHGFGVAGIEVSSFMQQQAKARLSPEHHTGLLLGDFLTAHLPGGEGYQVVYWNDVLEHLPPDESFDFVRRVHDILSPGGVLVTITPNWHTRPMDITRAFQPPRTEARGFHLKEYTLREVTTLLRRAGFARVATPLLVTRQRTILCGNGLCSVKRLLEPTLERLPFSLARLICRGAGLTTTLAWKAERTN